MLLCMMLISCADGEEMTESPYLNGKDKTPIAIAIGMKDAAAYTRTLGMTDAAVYTRTPGMKDTAAHTRAVDGSFEQKDELIAYIRHVDKDNKGVYNLVSGTGVGPRLARFEIKTLMTEHHNAATNYGDPNASTLAMAEGEVPLYWDDFSRASTSGEEEGAYDIRTTGHALEVYYGYCFNGGEGENNAEGVTIQGNISQALEKDNGELGWTVQENQSTDDNLKHSDLLFAKRQTPPAQYVHDKNNRKKLMMDFSHAMSKVTVEVVCSDGFDDNVDENFKDAVVQLNGVRTQCEVCAPDEKVMISKLDAAKKTITMRKGAATDNKLSCTFTALMAPSLIKADDSNPFLTIKQIDGNDYKLYLTDDIITKKNATEATDSWSKKLADSTVTYVTPSIAPGYQAAKGGYTLPGVNYYIKVTLKKQAIDAKASIRDWSQATAEGDGKIDIPNDGDSLFVFVEDDTNPGAANATIEIKTMDKDKFVPGATFSLYLLKDKDGENTEKNNDAYKWATTCTFVNETAEGKDDHWDNAPLIYWPNVNDKYYFRALAKFNSQTNSLYSISSVHNPNNASGESASADQAVSQGTIEGGSDILWATTPRHYGRGSDYDPNNGSTYRTYEKGAAIPPRTGGVPLAFQHIMTKVTFNLEDANKDATLPSGVEATDYDNPLNPRINLAGAKIQITNLSTQGTVTVENGNVTASSSVADKVFGNDIGYNPYKLNGVENSETSELLHEYIMVPQIITDDAILTVTLKDGTTYKLQLNTCVQDGTNTSITKWLRGIHYTYTITLTKEAISFRVMIKNWDEKTGSGNANLDWD